MACGPDPSNFFFNLTNATMSDDNKKELLTETDYGRCSKAEQEETGFK